MREKSRGWQCSYPTGPLGKVEQSDFLLWKGLVVSSLPLAMHREWTAGIAGSSSLRQGELVGPEPGQGDGDRGGREGRGMEQNLYYQKVGPLYG